MIAKRGPCSGIGKYFLVDNALLFQHRAPIRKVPINVEIKKRENDQHHGAQYQAGYSYFPQYGDVVQREIVFHAVAMGAAQVQIAQCILRRVHRLKYY